MKSPHISSADLRQALSSFATGVTVITARGPDGAVGLTVSSFNSVSLQPALVLWSLGVRAGSLAAFQAASHYAIHVLQADQRELAMRFSRQSGDRFVGLEVRSGLGDAPLLAGAAAIFECRNHHQHPEGDHIVFVGEVQRISHVAHAQPLLYHGGKFYTELPAGSATTARASHWRDWAGLLSQSASNATQAAAINPDLEPALSPHEQTTLRALLLKLSQAPMR